LKYLGVPTAEKSQIRAGIAAKNLYEKFNMPNKYAKEEPHTFYMDMQIYLSALLNLIDMLGAGTLTMHDIIMLNRTIKIDEVRNFFVLMEVYGATCSTDNENFFTEAGLDDIEMGEVKKTKRS